MRLTIEEKAKALLDKAITQTEDVYVRDLQRGSLDEAVNNLHHLRAIQAIKKQIRIVIENEAKNGKSKSNTGK